MKSSSSKLCGHVIVLSLRWLHALAEQAVCCKTLTVVRKTRCWTSFLLLRLTTWPTRRSSPPQRKKQNRTNRLHCNDKFSRTTNYRPYPLRPNSALPYLTLPPRWTGSYTCPALRPLSAWPNARPRM